MGNQTPDNQCCGTAAEPTNDAAESTSRTQVFETAGAVVKIEINDKPSRGDGYLSSCHRILDEERAAGSRVNPLNLRLRKFVDAFKQETAQYRELWGWCNDVKNQIQRVLPIKFRDSHIVEQVRAVVERLLDVQKQADAVTAAHLNQFNQLSKIACALNPVDHKQGEPVAPRVVALVEMFERTNNAIRVINIESAEIGHALNQVDADVTLQMGIDTRFSGTVAQRIRKIGADLLLALQANRAWADCKGSLPTDERAQYKTAIENLTAENAKLRNLHIESENSGTLKTLIRTLRRENDVLREKNNDLSDPGVDIYVKSVAESHRILNEHCVPECGDVPNRLRVLFSGRK